MKGGGDPERLAAPSEEFEMKGDRDEKKEQKQNDIEGGGQKNRPDRLENAKGNDQLTGDLPRRPQPGRQSVGVKSSAQSRKTSFRETGLLLFLCPRRQNSD